MRERGLRRRAHPSFEKQVLSDLKAYHQNTSIQKKQRANRIKEYEKRKKEEDERKRIEEEKRLEEEERKRKEEEERLRLEEEQRVKEQEEEERRKKEEEEKKALEDERQRLLEIENSRKAAKSTTIETPPHSLSPATVASSVPVAAAAAHKATSPTADDDDWKQFEEHRRQELEWQQFERERAGSESSGSGVTPAIVSDPKGAQQNCDNLKRMVSSTASLSGSQIRPGSASLVEQPVQIPGYTSQISQNTPVINSIMKPSQPVNFNFKDFEAETDVFADMELKTINDMAELSSILGGGNSQPAPGGGGENKSSQNQQFLVQNKPNAYAFQNPNPFAGVPGQGSMQPGLTRLPNGQMSYTNSGYPGQTAVSSANSQQFPAYNLYMAHYRPQGYSATVCSSSYPANVSSASYQSAVASTGYPAVISSSAYQSVTSTGYPTVVSSTSYLTNVSSSGYPVSPISSAAYQAGYPNASTAVHSQMNSNTQLKSSSNVAYHSSMANNSAVTISSVSATASSMMRPTASMLPGQKLPGSNVPGGQLYSGGAAVTGNLPYPGRNGPVATFASNTYTQSIHSVAAGSSHQQHNGYAQHNPIGLAANSIRHDLSERGNSRSKSTDRGSVDVSPESSEESPPSGELKPSRSVGDIISQLQEEARSIAEHKRKQMQTPPPPGTSLNRGMEDWIPWPDIDQGKLHKKKEESVLQGLGEEEMKMCQQLAEMGFPMPRLAKAVRCYGADSQKLLNFCVSVDKLVERGYKEEACLEAVALYHEDENKSRNHLDGFGKLSELGFEPNKVHEALSKSDQDYQKALDRLIS